MVCQEQCGLREPVCRGPVLGLRQTPGVRGQQCRWYGARPGQGWAAEQAGWAKSIGGTRQRELRSRTRTAWPKKKKQDLLVSLSAVPGGRQGLPGR